MAKVKIGLGRLYNASFCSLNEGKDIIWELQLKDIDVLCKLSKQTQWGKLIFNEDDDKNKSTPSTKLPVYPSPDKYPAELYFDVTAYKWIELNDDISVRLAKGDSDAINEVYKIFALHNDDLRQAVDYTSGMLGLQKNSELVRVPILDVDQKYIFISDALYSLRSGLALQVRQTINFVYSETGNIKIKRSSLKLNDDEGLEKATECLAWLLRGWAAEDYVLKFISFFTALEPVIPPAQESHIEKFTSNRTKLLKLVKIQGKNDDRADMTSFLNSLSPYIPIAKRFDQWASDVKLENWKNDIKEFIRFNGIRNQLLHRGDASIFKEPHVTNTDIEGLEYLTQKYLNWALYEKRGSKPINKVGKTIISVMANFKISSDSKTEFPKSSVRIK